MFPKFMVIPALVYLLVIIFGVACTADSQDDTSVNSEAQMTETPTRQAPTALSVTAVSCEAIVQRAYALTEEACKGTQPDTACYGNIQIVAQPDTVNFAELGDVAALSEIDTLRLSSMNMDRQEWGVSLIRVEAHLSDDSPTQAVELLLFGDVEITDTSDQQTTQYGAMQAFTFVSGKDDRPCPTAPDSGILVQTPQGVGEITLLVNEVVIDLGSTAYLQAQAGRELVVNVVEGQGTVSSQGQTVTVAAGMTSRVPLDAAGVADGIPSPPEAIDTNNVQTLPVTLLDRPVAIATAQATSSVGIESTTTNTGQGEPVDITAEGRVSASTTYEGFSTAMSVDGDLTSSWFSAGIESSGNPTQYRWDGVQDDIISSISIISNAQHSNPAFQTGFGFGQVTVQVLDANDNVVYETSVDLAGTPDPDVLVEPNVVGRSVVLLLSGHEDSTCGGFAELQITALRS